jgi:hypothetical protein
MRQVIPVFNLLIVAVIGVLDMYKIYLRDNTFRRIGEITDFKQLEMVPKFNAVGSFTLDMPTDSPVSRSLINNQYGIIVKKDNKSIFSGNVLSSHRSFSASGDTITFSGVDDNNFLASIIAYPSPNGNFSLSDYDVRTGSAETIMKQYVDVNAGPNALPERSILTIQPDTGIGLPVSYSARFENLLDLLSSIALNGGGLGFRVVQVDNGLQFQVYQPTDKSKSVFFSPILGNVSAFDYANTAPTANAVIVGGGGIGVNRIILQKTDNSSITKYGRFESFVDQRNTSDTTQLNQSLDEELTNKKEQNSFVFTPIDIPALQFNRDYGLGDKVTIVITQPNEIIEKETLYYFLSFYQTALIENERIRKIQEKIDVIQDIVREVKITITPNQGVVVSPLVGTSDSLSPEVPKIFDKMKKLIKRISNLERV